MTADPFLCANANCHEVLGRDHVTLITTCHMRRFCSVECIADGQRAHHAAIAAATAEQVGFVQNGAAG